MSSLADHLSKDCHGRVVTTHRCPECGETGAGFLSQPGARAPMCRGTADNGFHPAPVETLPIIGCDLPPDQSYSILISGYSVLAPTPTRAREGALATVQDILGGDTKLAAKIMDRLGFLIEVVPNAAVEGEGRWPAPVELRWERRDYL